MTGKELRKRRMALGLSQGQIAEMAGVTGDHRRQAVYRWENGIREIPAAEGALLDIRLADLERKGRGDGRKRKQRKRAMAPNMAS